MFAAVDLGSNSFRLHIGVHDGETIRVVKSSRESIRFAAGLDQNGFLTETAMQGAVETLRRFNAILASFPLQAVRVVATNTFRVAKNAAEFLPLAEQAVGYPIEIISGEEEGRLIYMGVACSVAQASERRLVLDIGGGSTELILGRGSDIEHVESFGIGTVKQSLAFFPDGRIDAATFAAATLSARSHFEDAAPPYQPDNWSVAYGSSGTMRAISDAILKNGLGDGALSPANLDALRQRLIAFGSVDKIDLVGLKPERAAVLVGGLTILIGVIQELGIASMRPIAAGLRMGVMWDLYLRATRRDRREQAVRDCLQRFHVVEKRANSVAAIAVALYRQLKPASDALAKQLYWSALLHEVGLAVSQTDYHKHGAYLIEHADLPGFTTREQKSMSRLILAHKGNLRKVGDVLANPDAAKAVLALRLAVIFMHARIDPDPGSLRLKMKSRIELDLRRDWIASHPTISYWMEKEINCWEDVDVDFIIKSNA
ncbi:Ppx/GppA phosphatase family protein [Herminiimonas sp. CN]|uniref:Ppx/GppA phosphatase family protein n=1 Tax=Herminiimonas sp. CN TaxID=1349818 RepID=UPI0004730547|nr:Ppx/GppA phosphatase family protein [Herminiimonas sp. CN]